MLLSVRLELAVSECGVSTDIFFDERLALEAATASLVPGKILSSCRASCMGTVVARRLHGSSLMFVDIAPARRNDSAATDVGCRVQVIVTGASLCVAIAGLAFRLGSTIAVTGCCGRSRRDEFSLYASAVSLLQLPPEPAALFRVAQAVSCNIMSVVAAAAVVGCAADNIEELAGMVERAQMDATDEGCMRACRQLTASLRGGGGRIRPPKFNGAELEMFARLQGRYCSIQVES